MSDQTYDAGGHHMSVSGDSDPNTENEITCNCGWKTSVLPAFVLPVVQRHGVLFAGLKLA